MLLANASEGTSTSGAPQSGDLHAPRAWRRAARVRPGLLLAALIVTTSLAFTVAAMRTTSTTFDEILLPAAGARGFETGRFDLIVEQPPLMEYLYGLPVWLSGPRYPAESGRSWTVADRYEYAQDLFWRSGNDPERLALLARLVAAALTAALTLSVMLLTMARFGTGAGLVAGLLVAFLPDTLAHGGVTWNDLPAALALFWAVWALDRAVRRPGVAAGVVAGVLVALALGVKFTAVALAPLALLLAVAEGVSRRWERQWLRRVLMTLDVSLAVAYLCLVVLYRGDFALHGLRMGLMYQVGHAAAGNAAPLSFLGHRSMTGWWYFFPIAFLLKTPAALHLLLGVATVALIARTTGRGFRELLGSSLRMEVAALLVLGALLLHADLDIGFRYALPTLPFLLVVVGVGVRRAWDVAGRSARAALAAACLAYVASALSFYPHFLAYTSEYVPRSRASGLIVDSSLDWGQGLLELRGFLDRQNVDRVYLAYFGSALPEGYGIATLPADELLAGAASPDALAARAPYLVVSATLLAGAYLPTDPFAPLRALRPTRVIAGSLLVYPSRQAAMVLRTHGVRRSPGPRSFVAVGS